MFYPYPYATAFLELLTALCCYMSKAMAVQSCMLYKHRLRIKHVLDAVERLYTSAQNRYKFLVLCPVKGYESRGEK